MSKQITFDPEDAQFFRERLIQFTSTIFEKYFETGDLPKAIADGIEELDEIICCQFEIDKETAPNPYDSDYY